MNIEDLSNLSLDELHKVKKRNYVLFHLLGIVDLVVFYHSMIYENWATLFLTLGVFVAGLALYDNYRVSRDIIDSSSK